MSILNLETKIAQDLTLLSFDLFQIIPFKLRENMQDVAVSDLCCTLLDYLAHRTQIITTSTLHFPFPPLSFPLKFMVPTVKL